MKKVDLWGSIKPFQNPEDEFSPYLDIHLLETADPVGAVVIFPGGGYAGRANHEGAPIAEFYNRKGMHAFVVQYRVAPHRHPAPLADALRAVRIVRNNADKWKIIPDKIATLGFSAGGHLAACTGVHFDLVKKEDIDLLDNISPRPDALILCYPVITSKLFAHTGSLNNLLGKGYADDLRDLMCLEEQIDKTTPPSFLWHTAADQAVPVENSLLFCNALSKFKIPFELHIFPEGRHGLGLAADLPEVAVWADLSATWLKNMGW